MDVTQRGVTLGFLLQLVQEGALDDEWTIQQCVTCVCANCRSLTVELYVAGLRGTARSTCLQMCPTWVATGIARVRLGSRDLRETMRFH